MSGLVANCPALRVYWRSKSRMNTVVFIVAIIVLALLALFVIPQWRMRRAIRQVIRILRQNNAVDVKTAKTIDELGLRPRRMLEGMFKGRDYKQYALNTLVKAEILKAVEGGRLYLSEERLSTSGLERNTPYSRWGAG